MRRVLPNLLLLLVTLLITTILIEIVLRTTHLFDARLAYTVPDSVLAYRFVPHGEFYYHKENPKAISGTFNNFGWRDRDWTTEKPAGVTRVAMLGDSFLEAFQVELESTFVRVAERSLREQHHSVELMNFGRSGFTQTDELWLLQNDVANFSPDIVFISFLPFNDIEDVRRTTAPDLERPFYVQTSDGQLKLDASFTAGTSFAAKSKIDALKRNSVLISFLAERYSMYKLERDIAKQSSAVAARAEKLGGYLSLCTARPDSEYVRSYSFSKLLITRMAEYCAARGITMVLMCLDTDAYLPEQESEMRAVDSTFNPNFFEDDLRELSSALQIRYLGLQRTFRDAYMASGKRLHWGHWNYEGHRVAGRAVSTLMDSLLQSRNVAH